VCNEVFKAELVEVTAELAQFGPSPIGPIRMDPDSGWRRPKTLLDHVFDEVVPIVVLVVMFAVAGRQAVQEHVQKCSRQPRPYECDFLDAVAALVWSMAEVAWDCLFPPEPEPKTAAPVLSDPAPSAAPTDLYRAIELVAQLNAGAVLVLWNMVA
jgi:hypothetical protein